MVSLDLLQREGDTLIVTIVHKLVSNGDAAHKDVVKFHCILNFLLVLDCKVIK